ANILKFLEMNQGKVKTQVSMVETDDTPAQYVREFKEIWHGKVDRIRVYKEHSKEGVFGSIENPIRERKPCMMPQYEVLVYCDGNIGRCNHDWDGPPMGNVVNNTLLEVWTNKAYRDLRKEHMDLTFKDPVCSKCDSWYPVIGEQQTGEVVES
ncbi:SPASM domain-containing protein, partial [bacterium]|nr:SPASM domain-containing protein [bacterium]